ncbi:unnamed protein product, partial [Closterium sp. NIES-54]
MNVGVAARPSPPDAMHPSDHFAPSHPFADPSVCLTTRLSPPDCFSASLSSSPSRCGSEALKATACRPAGGLRERPSLLGPQGLEQEWAAIFGEDDGDDVDNGGYGDDVDHGYPGNDGNNGGEREEEDDEEDVPWEVISSRLRQQLKQVLHQQKQQHVQLSHARTHDDGYHSRRHSQTLGQAPPQLNASAQKDPSRDRLESCQQWEQSINNDRQSCRRTASYRDSGSRENSSREGSSREEINWLAQACTEGRSKQMDRRSASRRSFDVVRSGRHPVSETVSVSVTGAVSVSGSANRDCSAHSSPVPLQQRRRSHSEVPPLLVTVPKSSLERVALSNKKGSPALPPSVRQGACSSLSPSDLQQKAFPPRSPRSNLSVQALRTSSLSPDSPSVSPRSSSAALAAALAASRKAESFREDLDSSDEEFLAAYCHITSSPTAESPVASPPSAASAGSAFRGPVVRALQKSASCLEGRGEQRQAPVRAQAGRAQLAKSQETLFRKGGASGGASGARDAHARVRAQEAADVPQRSYTAPSGGGKQAPFVAPFAAVIAHQNLEKQNLHLKKQLQQAQQLKTAIGGGFGGGSVVSTGGSSCSGLSGSDLARGLGNESGGKQAGGAAAAAGHGARATGGTGGASSAGSQAQPPNAAQARSRGKGGHADTPAGGAVSAGARKLFGLGSQSQRMFPRAATTGGASRSLVRGRSWASLEFQRAQDPPRNAPHLEELVPCTKGLPTIESSGSGGSSGSGNGGGSSRSREKGSGGSRTVSFSERHSALLSPADSPRARAGAAAPPLSAMGRASSAAAGGASRGSPSFPHERSALPELPGLAKRALLAQAQEGTGASGAAGTLAGAGAPGLSRTSSARQLYVQKMLLDLAAQSDEASEAGSGSGSGHASPCVASGGGSGTGGSGKGGRSGLSKRGVLGRSVSGKEHAGRRAGATAQEGAEAAQLQLGAVRRSASARYQPASRLSVDFSAAASAGLTGGENGGGGCGEGKSLGRSASDKAMQGGDQARMVGLPSISGAISGAAATVRGKVSTVLVDPFASAYNREACDEDEDDEDLFDILAAMRSMQTSPQSPSPLSPLHPPPRSPVPLSPSPANSPHAPPHHTYSRDPSPAPRAPPVPRPSSPPPPPLLRSPSPDSRSPSPSSRTASQPNHPSSLSVSHPNNTPARSASQHYSSAPGPSYESPPRSPPLSPLGSSSASSPRSPPLTPPRNNRCRSLHIPSRSMPSALARPNRRHSTCEDRPLNMTHPTRQPGSASGGGGGPFAAANSRGASATATRAFAISRSLNSSSSAAASAAAAVKATGAARRGQAGVGEGKLGGGGGGAGRHAVSGSSGSGNCNGGGNGSGSGDAGDRSGSFGIFTRGSGGGGGKGREARRAPSAMARQEQPGERGSDEAERLHPDGPFEANHMNGQANGHAESHEGSRMLNGDSHVVVDVDGSVNGVGMSTNGSENSGKHSARESRRGGGGDEGEEAVEEEECGSEGGGGGGGGGRGMGGVYQRKSKVMDKCHTMSGYNKKNITDTITVKFKDVRYKVQTAKAGSWDPRHSCLPTLPTLPALLAPKRGGTAGGGGAEAGAGGKAGAEVREKEILHGISGSVAPGEVLAMMGPSGGGKTTFLNVLGGRFKQGNMAGTLTYNDLPYSKALKRKLGFVTQDDIFFPHLTVRETLMYAAVLRLPKELSWAEKVQRADETITELGLDKCRNTVIGGPFLRGISGGERKRVSIGHEILINPSMLLLDEPTSGLDSTTALRIIQVIQNLAKSGRTVVTTIHQPSSRLFHAFDKLLLLSEGNVIFFGQAADAMGYFGRLGFEPLFATNPADFLLDLATGTTADVRLPGVLGESEEWQRKSVPEQQHDVKEFVARAHREQQQPLVHAELAGLPTSSDADQKSVLQRRGWTAPWLLQFSVLWTRGLKERRHEVLSPLRFYQVTALGFICGMLWFGSERNTAMEIQDQVGLLFFISIFWGFFPLFAAIFTFPQERSILAKERASDMYRLSAYYLSRQLSDLPMEWLLPTLFLLICYFMANLKLTAAAFFGLLFSTYLIVTTAQ